MASTDDILDLLPANRRQEIIAEALGGAVREIFTRHASSELGELVQALTKDARWDVLKTLPVSAVMRPAAAPGPASGRRRGRPPKAEAAPPKGGRKRRGQRAKASTVALEQLLAVIQSQPGLRSEQIQKETGLDANIVKPALVKLREANQVNTKGQKRSTTYYAA